MSTTRTPTDARDGGLERVDAREVTARMLHERGLRLTAARAGVASVLLGQPQHRHLTAAQLLDHLRERDQPADRATVYRAVNALSDVGLLHASPTAGGATSYGLAVTPHHHVLCTRCGTLEPLPAQPLTDALGEVAGSTRFEVPADGATLLGLCPTCRPSSPTPSRGPGAGHAQRAARDGLTMT